MATGTGALTPTTADAVVYNTENPVRRDVSHNLLSLSLSLSTTKKDEEITSQLNPKNVFVIRPEWFQVVVTQFVS